MNTGTSKLKGVGTGCKTLTQCHTQGISPVVFLPMLYNSNLNNAYYFS